MGLFCDFDELAYVKCLEHSHARGKQYMLVISAISRC